MSDPPPLWSVSETSAFLVMEAHARSAANAVLGWADAGLTVRTARGRQMRTVERLFDEMAAALQFPYYFGENWNAFDECLSDMDWLPLTVGIVILVQDAAEVLSDAVDVELSVLARLIESARREYSAPIELGEWWDRPPVPFHVVLHSSPADSAALRALWQKAGATLLDLPAEGFNGNG
jgi:RNAse (barnase) inhibitor barstar